MIFALEISHMTHQRSQIKCGADTNYITAIHSVLTSCKTSVKCTPTVSGEWYLHTVCHRGKKTNK